jgi:hypothetical protein
MKIRHLFESEMILLESYKDFDSVWKQLIFDATRTKSVPREAMSVPKRLENLLRNQQHRSFIMGLEKERNVGFSTLGIRNLGDVSSWMSSLQTTIRNYGRDLNYVIEDFTDLVDNLERYVEETIASRNPDYTTIKKTPSYIIFDAKNFAAARSLRNKVGATWCIGSTEEHFLSYGVRKNMKTYIIFLNRTKKGMVFHVNPSNPNNNLITSHDNNSEGIVVDAKVKTTRGSVPVLKDLSDALSSKEIDDVMTALNLPYAGSFIQISDSPTYKNFLKSLGSSSYLTSEFRSVASRYTEAFKRLKNGSEDDLDFWYRDVVVMTQRIEEDLHLWVYENKETFDDPNKNDLLSMFLNTDMAQSHNSLKNKSETYRSFFLHIIEVLTHLGYKTDKIDAFKKVEALCKVISLIDYDDIVRRLNRRYPDFRSIERK